MADQLEIEIGAAGSWLLEIDDLDDAPVTTYLGTETLAVACWPGDDRAPIFSASGAWADASSGRWRLDVTPQQSALLSPGEYLLQLTIAGTRKRTFGPLVALPSPGTAAARPVYCTRDEMLREAGSWAPKLLRADTDQTGFAEERADAREEFEEWIQAHYRGTGNGLGAAFGAYSPWTYRRGGFADPWLADQLAADRLIRRRRVVQCVACLALAKVCARQIDPTEDKGWGAAARHYGERAESIAATLAVEIDTDGDGRGDVIIHLGTVDSLRG